MNNYTIKTEFIENGPGIMNSLRVNIFRNDELEPIGSYIRMYHNMYNTFHPFMKDGKEYALFSDEYWKTSVMTLPDCVKIATEQTEYYRVVEPMKMEGNKVISWGTDVPATQDEYNEEVRIHPEYKDRVIRAHEGFCPTDFYVPPTEFSNYAELLEDENGNTLRGDDGKLLYGPKQLHYDVYNEDARFAFVAGCIWGDDTCQPSGTMVLVPDGSPIFNKRQYIYNYKYVPIESLLEGDIVVSLRNSGGLRAKGSLINKIGSHNYNGNLVVIKTDDGRISKYTPDHKCIAKIGPALKDKYIVYMMNKGNSYRIGSTKGIKNGGLGLLSRLYSEHGENGWILSVHNTRAEALAEEVYVSWKYGIPDMRFVAWGAIGHRNQEVIDAFWNRVGDITSSAINCLHDFNRLIEYPILTIKNGSNVLVNRACTIRACNLISGSHAKDGDALINAYRKRLTGSQQFISIMVENEQYDGLVYGMDVDIDHTYIADGVATNNSWKIEWLDLSKIDEGIVGRSDKFGYISLPPGISLKEAIIINEWEDGEATITIAIAKEFKMNVAEHADIVEETNGKF